MKKLLLTAAVIMASLTASAQLFTVGSIDRLAGDTRVEKSVISPDGSFVVGYAPANHAIMKIDASNGSSAKVAEGEGLYNLRLTGDQNTVIFTRPTVNKKHMRYISLEAASLADGKVQVLVKPTRRLNHGIAVAGSTVTAVENGKVRTKTLVKGEKSQSAPVASISYGHLQVTNNGKTVTIDPQGRGSYLWPSVSPDGTKVLYWLVGRGCFVANLDGSDARSLGNLRSAVFCGNDMVVGAAQRGNDQVIAESRLVAKRIADGTTQMLTDENTIALDPSASADGSRISFTDLEGAVYIINIVK